MKAQVLSVPIMVIVLIILKTMKHPVSLMRLVCAKPATTYAWITLCNKYRESLTASCKGSHEYHQKM